MEEIWGGILETAKNCVFCTLSYTDLLLTALSIP